MRVYELKKILEEYDDDAEVNFFVGYHTIKQDTFKDRKEACEMGFCWAVDGFAFRIEAVEKVDVMRNLILTPTGNEFSAYNLKKHGYNEKNNMDSYNFFTNSLTYTFLNTHK